jgi:DNA-binding SARP family transcriptional activator
MNAPPIRIRIEIFGAPRVLRAGAALKLARKSMALLAFVALERRVTRARLAAVFWGDLDGASARRNLRRELHRLGEAGTADALALAGDAVALAAGVDCDVADFEAAVAAGNQAAAIDLYRGPMLDGADIDAPEFIDWLARERGRLAAAWRHALQSRAAADEAAGRTTAALAAHRQLIAEDALQERHYREAMRLAAALGEREAALDLFERCKAILGRELGLRPTEETRALAERIRSGIAPASTAPSPSAPTQPFAPTLPATAVAGNAALLPQLLPLVGRDALLKRIARHLAEPRAVVLAGPGGVGKTRLALAALAQRGPHVALAARPGDRETPYAVLRRALAPMLADPALALPAWVRSQAARVLPELGSAAPPLADDQDRARQQAALLHLWQRHAPAGPHGLLLDDLHLFDEASLAFALHLLDRAPPPALITLRDEALPAAARAQLETRVSAGAAVAVDVAPLAHEDIVELVRQLAGTERGERFARRLYRATGGLPLFVLETLRCLVDTGELSLDERGAWRTPYDADTEDYRELPVPASVRDAVARRLHTLDDTAARLLRVAALVEDPFDAAWLTGATALSEEESAAALDRAAAMRLVQADDRRWRFTHDLVRQALAETLPLAQRRLVHRKLAATAERQRRLPAAIAEHYEQGNQPQAAAGWRIQAARAAAAAYALEEAQRQYERALADGAAPRQQVDIHLELARVAALRGDLAAADRAYDAALSAAHAAAHAEPHGGKQGTHARQLDVALARAEHDARANRVTEAIAAADTLLATGIRGVAAARALSVKATCVRQRGDAAAADALCREGLAQPPPGPLPLRAELFDELGFSAYTRGDYAQARRCNEQALRVHALNGNTSRQARNTTRAGAFDLFVGRYDSAIAAFERALALARSIGDVPSQRHAATQLMKALGDSGDFEQAAAVLADTEPLAAAAPRAADEVALLSFRLGIAHGLGRFDRALAAADDMLALAAAGDNVRQRIYLLQGPLDLYLDLGHVARARELANTLRGAVSGLQLGPIAALVAACEARVRLAEGRARDALDVLATIADEDRTLEEGDLLALAAARAHLALGDPQAALAQLPDRLAFVADLAAAQLAVRIDAQRMRDAVRPDDLDEAARRFDAARMPVMRTIELGAVVATAMAPSNPTRAAQISAALCALARQVTGSLDGSDRKRFTDHLERLTGHMGLG